MQILQHCRPGDAFGISFQYLVADEFWYIDELDFGEGQRTTDIYESGAASKG